MALKSIALKLACNLPDELGHAIRRKTNFWCNHETRGSFYNF
ncbi:MAG: hypothetical protein OXG65_13535 [Chloroflexi bacterium]|nr:hypothetical protein [Chloroflexota bacterium]